MWHGFGGRLENLHGTEPKNITSVDYFLSSLSSIVSFGCSSSVRALTASFWGFVFASVHIHEIKAQLTFSWKNISLLVSNLGIFSAKFWPRNIENLEK